MDVKFAKPPRPVECLCILFRIQQQGAMVGYSHSFSLSESPPLLLLCNVAWGFAGEHVSGSSSTGGVSDGRRGLTSRIARARAADVP